MSKKNPPQKHHYVPVFYLSRWALEDGRLCQFSRPYKEVTPKRTHPSGTGYLNRLYELDGLEGDLAQQLEQRFFSPVDSAAADALKLMEDKGNTAKWDARRRSAWSRFIHSLLLRMPEDLEVFKSHWRKIMVSDETGEWESRFRAIPHIDPGLTFQSFIENIDDATLNRSAMITLMDLINDAKSGEKLNNLKWWIIDTDQKDYPLLTSDRPVIRTNGLTAPNGHIVLPIGPFKIFIAAKDQRVLDTIRLANSRRLVREINRQVCGHAVRHVYGVDDSQFPFVRKHFGTEQQTGLLVSASREIAALAGLSSP